MAQQTTSMDVDAVLELSLEEITLANLKQRGFDLSPEAVAEHLDDLKIEEGLDDAFMIADVTPPSSSEMWQKITALRRILASL